MAFKKRTGFGAIEFLLITVILLVVGGLAWYALMGKPKAVQVSPVPSASSAVAVDEYAGWNTYSAKYEGFSLRYPTNWKLTQTKNTYSELLQANTEVKGPFESMELSSPGGVKITYTTHITGLGGACPDPKEMPEYSCPNIHTIAYDKVFTQGDSTYFVSRLESLDYTTNKAEARQLSLSQVATNKTPSIGTAYGALYPSRFHLNGTDKLAGLSEFLESSLQATASDDEAKPSLSSEDFFNQSDWKTAAKILKSVRPN